MFVTPLVAAWLVGSFWTGAALATIHGNGDEDERADGEKNSRREQPVGRRMF